MKERFEGMAALRAAACLLIITFHCYLHQVGPFSVTLFFYAAGFSAACADLERADIPGDVKGRLAFSFRKIKSFYPLYLITLLIMLGYTLFMGRGQMDGAQLGFQLKAFLSHLFMVQSWLPDLKYALAYNGAAWFFSDLAFMYLLLPYMLDRMRRYRTKRDAYRSMAFIALLMTAVAFGGVKIYDGIMGEGAARGGYFAAWLTKFLPVYRLGDFMLGANLAWLMLHREKKGSSPAKGTVTELAVLTFWAVTQWLSINRPLPPEMVNSVWWLLPCSLVIYVLVSGEGYISRLLRNKAVDFVANMDGELYLIHQVLIFIVTALFNMLPLPQAVMKWGALALILCGTLLISRIYGKVFGQIKAGEHWL